MIQKSRVSQLPITGPWRTKSKGKLNVLFNFRSKEIEQFIFNNTDNSISGLRAYRVSALSEGSTGANEWHKLRTELVFTIKGRTRWECLDQNGEKSIYILSPESDGLQIPPYILHTYTSLVDDSEILVIANTSFDPDAPETHDTYPSSSF